MGQKARLNALVTLVKPVIEEHAAFLAEKHLPLFFNADSETLGLSDLQRVSFSDGFVEKTNVSFNLLTIDENAKLAAQLVEGEFDGVPLYFSYLKTEFHTRRHF